MLEQTLLWTFRAVCLGLLVYFAKGWWEERNKRRPPGEQFITLDSLVARCKECHGTMKEDRQKGIRHLDELIKQRFQAGDQRFHEIQQLQKDQTSAINSLTQSVTILQTKVQSLNGFNRD